jgi:phospholipid/cholesterol/gamma-HCH transport system permease protein
LRNFTLATAPLLTATPSGDALELRPAGSWTAANAATLERLSNDVAPQLDRAAAVRVDMAGVRELDTLGAWLLEKISRRASSAGHRADTTGIADNYAGLIDEVRQVNRRTPAPAPASNPVIAKLGGIGRATIDAREDVTAFLQMLGALCIAILGVLRRPRSCG